MNYTVFYPKLFVLLPGCILHFTDGKENFLTGRQELINGSSFPIGLSGGLYYRAGTSKVFIKAFLSSDNLKKLLLFFLFGSIYITTHGICLVNGMALQ